jgi:large subunit ribosomal protein L5
MDVMGTLERPGYRIKRRRIRPAPVGKSHRVKKEEAIKFISEKFAVQIKEA